jgi:parallel beta-helix repeat protein
MPLTKTALIVLPLALLTASSARPTSAGSAAINPWPAAGSKQLFASPGGSDRNPGTRERPFRQVDRAADVATAGTVVHVAPGTYRPVTSANSGTPRAPIVFVSDRRWSATISAQGTTTGWANTAPWVVIQGFSVEGATYNGILSTSSNGRFLGNHVHHIAAPTCSRGGAGIVVESYSASNNDVIGNVVNDITAPGDCSRVHGIYLQSPRAGRIMNNLVHRTSGWGIHLWHNASSITISNNTVVQNRQGGILVGASEEGGGIAPAIATNIVVTNNIAAFNGGHGIGELGRLGRNTYANNLLYGNADGGYDLRSGVVPTRTVTQDPQFLRYLAGGGGDYRLRSTSPALDAGTSLRAPGYDLLTSARPRGSAVDIGAYESAR